MWKTVRTPGALAVTPNVLSHILTPKRHIHGHHPSASRCPSCRVHPFRTAQLSAQRVDGRR